MGKKKIQTRRSSKNKHNFEKRQAYDLRMLNKRSANNFKSKNADIQPEIWNEREREIKAYNDFLIELSAR